VIPTHAIGTALIVLGSAALVASPVLALAELFVPTLLAFVGGAALVVLGYRLEGGANPAVFRLDGGESA